MIRKFSILFGIMALISFSGCMKESAKQNGEKNKDEKVKAAAVDFKKMPFHGDMQSAKPGSTPLIDALKGNHLKDYPKKTIGEIFDPYRYVLKTQWLESANVTGGFYIDYIGWFYVNPLTTETSGIKEKGINFKFAVDKDGTTYITMAQNLIKMKDDKFYSTPLYPEQIRQLVDTIYENREIKF